MDDVEDYEFRDMTDGLTGSINIKSIATEALADINYGHYFALSDDGINVMNLQSDGYPTPSGCYLLSESGVADIEFMRPGRK